MEQEKVHGKRMWCGVGGLIYGIYLNADGVVMRGHNVCVDGRRITVELCAACFCWLEANDMRRHILSRFHREATLRSASDGDLN
jgi:hypothetical protein